jgi:PAS domain S-box-containing protein
VSAALRVPILVVDDNPAKRLAIKAVLAPLGFPIVEADSGLAALRCVTDQDFAVILLDVCMPTMDGFETAALIRQRWQSEMTPIVFITAFGNDEILNVNRYAEGAVDFIFAPVEPEALRAKVSVFANLFTKAALLATRAQDVQTSADQLRLLTDAAPIGIFQTDVDNRYVYTNPRWSEITGMTAEQAAGRQWDVIIGLEQRAELVVESGDGSVDRAEVGRRFEIPRPGSASRIVLVTSVRIPDPDGGGAGWVGTVADVTAEAGAEVVLSRARDEATEASRLKSDFLANMSHEIRTPMNGVIGMTDLLLDTDLDARQRDYAQTVRNSGEALLTIIEDILDFSKVEAGKLEVEDIEFSVRTIVDDVMDLLAGPAQSKGLELVTMIDAAVPAVVSGDPGRLRQVLTNLIGNATKFTRSGEVVVKVAVAGDAGVDTVIRFEVSDTGDGISPDKLAVIFQPFVQADTSTSRRYGGTGLGLAISSQLVTLMGGDCGVSSQLGEGSTFWFTIHALSDLRHLTRHLSLSEEGLSDVLALIVDDNATQRNVLSGYLTDWGMTVTTADSSDAALRELRDAVAEERPFALALVDRSMPGMGGLELLVAIDADPALRTPVVVMAGFAQEGDLGDPAAFGARATLTKPIHREHLLASVRLALGLKVPDVAPADVTSKDSPSEVSGFEAGHLLLAEDNLINQKVAVAMLSGAGYSVDTVNNGAAAVKAAVARRYDAILMDCQMPVMNGYEATTAIRSSEGAGRRTPIIAMTASARREDRKRCLVGGMDSYLSKPLSKDALLAVVARSVRERAAAESPSGVAGGSVDPEIGQRTGDGSRLVPRQSGHILLVEDNPVSQRVAEAMLENLGFDVDVVSDGSKAVSVATAKPYRAILMDCQTPVLDGYQATGEIRRLEGTAAHTPVIAVTASSMKSAQRRCLEAGMDDVLVKPLSLQALAAVLSRWVPDRSDPTVIADGADWQPAAPKEAASSPRPVLDAEIVARLERLGQAAGEDLNGQLAGLFLADADARVSALREAVGAADAAAVVRSAHSLSGASASLGASDLARLCATMATDGNAGELAGGGELLEAIEAELGRVCSALVSPSLLR